ncbi:MAG: cytochrome C [Ekhidna sp.]
MDDKKLNKVLSQITFLVRTIVVTLTLLVTLTILLASGALDTLLPRNDLDVKESKTQEIVDGIHIETGLIDSPGLQLVIQNCTNCHSSKLISQNRMNLAGWSSTIKWMQETQNLWDLGDNEAVILEYLASNYAPKKKGRRANLENIEWYELE